LIIGLLIAASVSSERLPRSPIVVRSPTGGFTANDIKADTQGYVRVRITVSPNGKPVRCEILVSSNSKGLDGSVCDKYQKAKFSAARDVAGQPLYGVVNMPVIVMVNRSVRTPPLADISLVVNRMPPGTEMSAIRTADLYVGATGTVTSCTPSNSEAIGPLDSALCSMATNRLSFGPALDENGSPVASIQSFSVEFSAADAPTERKEPLPDPSACTASIGNKCPKKRNR
jgi:TonB family protein